MTVLIVDDNTLIRNWLKIMLQQQGSEDLNILEAVDGNEALSICLSQVVDLLITDIRMPGMDGITLIKTLRTQRPAMQSAVLSSYDDFSYVRIALKCGALDYILKAEMQQEDISSLIEKAKERLAIVQGSEIHLGQYTEAIHSAMDVYSRFQHNPDNMTEQLLAACHLDCATSGMVMTIIKVVELSPGAGTQNAAPLCSLSLQRTGLRGLAFPIEDEQLLMLYAVSEDMSVSQKEMHLRLLSTLEQSLSAAKAGVMRQNVSLVLVPQDNFAKKLFYLKSLIDYQIYYQCSSLPENQSQSGYDEQKYLLNKVQTFLTVKNYQQAAEFLQHYIITAHKEQELPRRVRRNASAITQMMLSAFSDNKYIADELIYLDRLVQEISNAKTAEFLQRRVSEFCKSYLHLNNQEKSMSAATSTVIAYCNENFSHKITLEEVASMVRLNKSYFSQLFHKDTGVSFGEYLETLRIHNAQKMLQNSGASMSDIADMAGFSNQNYFTKVFKKVTGLTPSQYRASLFDAANGPSN